jgi:hypothetical protein
MKETFSQFIDRRHKQIKMPIVWYFVLASIPLLNIIFWFAIISNYYKLRKVILDKKNKNCDLK